MLATPRTSFTRGSLPRASVRVLSPASLRGDRADSPEGSWTTTRTGEITPLAPIVRSSASPRPDSELGGHQLAAGRPNRIPGTGAARQPTATPPTAPRRHGLAARPPRP